MRTVREMSAASLIVQCAFRCFRARKVADLKRRERDGATALQRIWRGRQGVLTWYAEHKKQSEQWAAWTIQRVYLGFRVRVFVRWVRAASAFLPPSGHREESYYKQLAKKRGLLLRRRNGWSEFALLPGGPDGRMLSAKHDLGERPVPAVRVLPKFYVPDSSARLDPVLKGKMWPWEVQQDWPLCCRTPLPQGDWDLDTAARRLRPHTQHGWWRPLPSACLPPCDMPAMCGSQGESRPGGNGDAWLERARALLALARQLQGHSLSHPIAEPSGHQVVDPRIPSDTAGWH